MVLTYQVVKKIKDLDVDNYNYSGVMQECEILQNEMKQKIEEEYIWRVKAVSKSFLYSRNLFTALNVWAVSVVRYTAGILDWTGDEESGC